MFLVMTQGSINYVTVIGRPVLELNSFQVARTYLIHHEVDAEKLERIQSGLEGFGKDLTDLACEIAYILLRQLAIQCWGKGLTSDQLID